MRTNRILFRSFFCAAIAVACLGTVPSAFAGDAPQWMHALVSRPVPPQDDKTDAVLLYDETDVTVLSADKIKTVVRRAYKILRPDGRRFGRVLAVYNS
ncbi:MAG: hypothetical protein ACRD3E_08195, partial [Terriglobales bacterium]